MQAKAINPYAKLGEKHKESLDYIIANLPVNPAFDDLNNKLTESFFTPDPADPSVTDLAEHVIKTILPNVYNGYVNSGEAQSIRHSERSEESPDKLSEGILRSQSLPQNDGNGYWRYNESQMTLIGQMLHGINTVPVEAIGEFLTGMEEEIVAGELSYEEQIPLLVAVQTGKSDWEYWQAKIAAPGAWAVYLNADSTINYLHTAGWVSSAVQGALLAYGLIKPPQVQFIDIHTAVIGSTGLVAGKVIWGWIN